VGVSRQALRAFLNHRGWRPECREATVGTHEPGGA
jgi:hypothetical protein